MNELIEWLIKFLTFIVVVSPFLKPLMNLIKSHTRNKNLIFAEKVAEQAVDFASKVSGITNTDRKEIATKTIYNRLKENGLGDRFTENQISQLIETAYTNLPKWWEN